MNKNRSSIKVNARHIAPSAAFLVFALTPLPSLAFTNGVINNKISAVDEIQQTKLATTEDITGEVSDVCEAMGSSLNAAKAAYENSCPNLPRVDCDPVDNGGWVCSSGVIGTAAPGTPSLPIIPEPTPEPTPEPSDPDSSEIDHTYKKMMAHTRTLLKVEILVGTGVITIQSHQ